MKGIFFLFMVSLLYASASAQSANSINDQVWKRELQYWEFVKTNDTAGYRTLWHDNFVGYPETEKLTGKDKIANWITDAYNKKGLRYEFSLEKKMAN